MTVSEKYEIEVSTSKMCIVHLDSLVEIVTNVDEISDMANVSFCYVYSLPWGCKLSKDNPIVEMPDQQIADLCFSDCKLHLESFASNKGSSVYLNGVINDVSRNICLAKWGRN